jgi:aryl carrier-like protein
VALADLWAEILGLDAVGVDEDFFALGGDSILLLKLCARARELGIALSPRALFAHPTIAELAAAL